MNSNEHLIRTEVWMKEFAKLAVEQNPALMEKVLCNLFTVPKISPSKS